MQLQKLKGRDHMEDRELEGGKILKCECKTYLEVMEKNLLAKAMGH